MIEYGLNGLRARVLPDFHGHRAASILQRALMITVFIEYERLETIQCFQVDFIFAVVAVLLLQLQLPYNGNH